METNFINCMACRFYSEVVYMDLDGGSYSVIISNPGSFFSVLRKCYIIVIVY